MCILCVLYVLFVLCPCCVLCVFRALTRLFSLLHSQIGVYNQAEEHSVEDSRTDQVGAGECMCMYFVYIVYHVRAMCCVCCVC